LYWASRISFSSSSSSTNTLKVEVACKAEKWPEAEVLIPQLGKQFKSFDLTMHEFLKTFK